jgi:hypothetical protein
LRSAKYAVFRNIAIQHCARELSLLDREIAKKFSYAEELSLARIIADSQGLGEHSGKT